MCTPEDSGILAGRVALVTGASRGIGKAIALELAAQGAKVAVNYQRSESSARDVATEIEFHGGTAVIVAGDISDPVSVDMMISRVIDELGDLHILVNNAGLNRDGLIVRMGADSWQQVIDTNLSGTFYCLQRCAKHMMKQRYGRIVNLSSVVGVEGNAGQANYAAAKAGMIGLTKSAAKELASRGITVNAVAPGFIETDMTAELKDAQRELILKQIPVARFGNAAEVAKLVCFLSSDNAAYITGSVLRIDGGIMM